MVGGGRRIEGRSTTGEEKIYMKRQELKPLNASKYQDHTQRNKSEIKARVR